MFDVLGACWTPRECYDNETASEYETWLLSSSPYYAPFPYFLDEHGKEKLQNKQAMSEHEGFIWTTVQEHVTHCVFIERRLHRAVQGKFKLDRRMSRFAHTYHCSEVVLDQLGERKRNLTEISTAFGVTYETCEID